MNEFFKLIKEAEKLYPNSDVLKVYKNNYKNYNINVLKKNLLNAIKRKK